MTNSKTGDKVSIKTESEEFIGILMPRPDILNEDITILKLDSGYNIGIDNKKIKETKLIEKYQKTKKQKSEIKPDPNLPNVSILSAGGTISSRIDYKTGGVSADYTAEDFIEMIPELKGLANLKAKKILEVMSEDMFSEDWLTIAKAVEKEIKEGAEGVVITQGTDTLHYTAAALSFLLKDLNIPVIITAAQRSIDRGSSDAYLNLSCAITAAAKFDAAEVMSCMHATTDDNYCLLIRGTKVRKMHTSRRDAFRPVNDLPIAEVYENQDIKVLNDYKKKNNNKCKAETKFEENIALIQIHPGINPKIIDFYIENDVKGIVLAATALGHIPTNKKHSLIGNIEKAIKKDIPIIIATQTLYGRTHPYVYTNLRKLSIQLDCIFVEDMLPETAFVKLGWALTKKGNIKELMQINIAGEITKRSKNKEFLY